MFDLQEIWVSFFYAKSTDFLAPEAETSHLQLLQ